MAVEMLERDEFLAALDALLRQAAEGHGRTVLVSGEAGIGKTSLVERFVERRQQPARVLWGICEALFTPRPLGPLYDMVRQAQTMSTRLRSMLEKEASRATLFPAVLDELASDALPTIVVFEDLHWADEATLDLVKFLARRIHNVPVLLILTYRDDELGKDHPLRLVLGDLPARDVTRLRMLPLSEAAVAGLAQQSGRSAEQLYAVTGGNPFFVAEVLASETTGAPVTVRDAVLTRAARLSPTARGLLELVAVVPGRVEREVIEHALGASFIVALEECLSSGMLRLEGASLAFRHELARQAMEGTILPTGRRALHAQVLRVLLEGGRGQIDIARLVHHAALAEDGALVLRYAPLAARQASAQGAHREAAAHYSTALRYADALEAEQRAELLDGLAFELYLTGQMEDVVAPCQNALAIWRALDQKERMGRDLCRLSRLSWIRGIVAEAESYGRESVALLETLPPGRELALAYGNLSHLYMLQSDTARTVYWATRAIELAERIQDYESLSYALNNLGSVELADGDERGLAKLERSLQLALDHGYEEHVGRAYANLATSCIDSHEYERAIEYVQQGRAYCAEHDLSPWEHCLRGQLAAALLDQGDWASAADDAMAILQVPWADGTNRFPALMTLGKVRVRRGDPGAEAVLSEARELAVATGDLDHVVPVAALFAEQHWLQGRLDECWQAARAGFEMALQHKNPWYMGEMAYWMWRSTGSSELPQDMYTPYALQITGKWRAAAEYWERVGCPYEQALALADGDEQAQRAALAIFERLGAHPLVERVRQHLLEMGVRGVPRGPRPTTRGNPLGLTNRQLEVAMLLAEGLPNAQIADRLSTSPKTVEHHVSAVLAKLGVRSRAEAVRAAHQLELVSLGK
jgi:DNA-binding CsgD family transcriptional regulator/tetratricopeptide (TPR) repeat protein